MIVLDLDGTLTNEKKAIPPSTHAAFIKAERLQKCHVHAVKVLRAQGDGLKGCLLAARQRRGSLRQDGQNPPQASPRHSRILGASRRAGQRQQHEQRARRSYPSGCKPSSHPSFLPRAGARFSSPV